MWTGLYPWELGLHENGRVLRADAVSAAQRLQSLGYRTAAFVSGFPLLGRFGLERGFDHYDDQFEGLERSAAHTNDRVEKLLADWGSESSSGPALLWVHYYDPHEPYEPPAEFLAEIADPYLAEIAALDVEIGRLIAMVEQQLGALNILLVADHGEGRGDHGEQLHGNLLYEGVMRVPMIVAGPGIGAAVEPRPVSICLVHQLLVSWAAGDPALPEIPQDAVLGEAMKPYLQYGWQPQAMVVAGSLKAIRDGGLQVFDVVADPAELRDLSSIADLPPEMRVALRELPVPQTAAEVAAAGPDAGDRARLAALGYVTFDSAAKLQRDAPNPRDMVHLFQALDLASRDFSQGDYRAASRRFEQILVEDPRNLAVLVRLAAAASLLGERLRADELFARASALDSTSVDVLHYRAMHALRFGDFAGAERGFVAVLERSPRRLAALEALSGIYERQARPDEALDLLQRALAIAPQSADLNRRAGDAAMALGRSGEAVQAFENARRLGDTGCCDLELGVLYLAEQRFDDARQALDRIPPDHTAWPMVLFKRAQVSVLLGEADRAARVRAAREAADAVTAELIARERLFEGY
jgi:Tfp pilus assembly protein PilF